MNKECLKFNNIAIGNLMKKNHPGVLSNDSNYKVHWDHIYQQGIKDNTLEVCGLQKFLKEVCGFEVHCQLTLGRLSLNVIAQTVIA